MTDKQELAALTAIDGNIANWLRRNNKTSAELADILGISTGTLSLKRNKQTKWNLSEILILLETLNCDFKTLTS